jgi:hypothetical protein
MAPLLISALTMIRLWLARAGVPLPLAPLPAAIATAFARIFGLGILLGRIGATSRLWSGIKTRLIALVTLEPILVAGG